MMTDHPRLIEAAFPLKEASLDSVHEKSVRHGHISTLHTWPARRPLAACRAALIATLLRDLMDPEERKELLHRLGGKVVQIIKQKKLPGGRVEEVASEETDGGILHWGRERNPDLTWFRDKIREAYGDRAPRVLDPFAGGGAIPLEAMRLGCGAVAVDINPVAWFILRCTLEYPQKLAGQKQPLPSFALRDRDLMSAFYKSQGLKGAALRTRLEQLAQGTEREPQVRDLFAETVVPEADLAWHIRAWGSWVFRQARTILEPFYPVADGKPTVAYLWARTITCKNCRAEVPLLKTRWLCKKDNKRVALSMAPKDDRTGVVFDVQTTVPQASGSTAQRRQRDKLVGGGTMSHSGATCPCCGTITTMADIRLDGKAGRLGAVMTSVVVDGDKGKEYRLPTAQEKQLALCAAEHVGDVFADIPFGLPKEPTPGPAGPKKKSSSLPLYGLIEWKDIFTPRQLLALGQYLRQTRCVRDALRAEGYPEAWGEAILAYLALAIDRLADYSSALCSWHNTGEKIRNTFGRFAFPVVWDFAEVEPSSRTSGSYLGAIEWIARFVEHALALARTAPAPSVLCTSATRTGVDGVDVIVTDPPYYDAIIYADIMDFFYVWLRRTLNGLSPEMDEVFKSTLAPKWDHEADDGELVDDPGRFGWDLAKSKSAYERGMYRAFRECRRSLNPDGRLVIVFAHKEPNAWETLVSAVIRAGFVVDGSWPVQTEMVNRTRALASAALSSSVWLVCKKRPEAARPGWDNGVLEGMRDKLLGKWDHDRKEWVVTPKLRDYWDAGIRGPDFVWAATGPALEAYSKYPVVKKANEPGQVMTVSEFLRHVRRIVVDFVVGRVLSGDGGTEAVSGLDDVTTYYLLHRHDFGMEDAPAGACILYAVSCGLSDSALADQYDLFAQAGGGAQESGEEDEEAAGDEAESEVEETSGSKIRLKPWHLRRRQNLGYEIAGGRPVPLIDQVHRLMHLWKAGDVADVNEYLDSRGLRRNGLFNQLLQALVELAPAGSDERSLLESISNHLAARGASAAVESRPVSAQGRFEEL